MDKDDTFEPTEDVQVIVPYVVPSQRPASSKEEQRQGFKSQTGYLGVSEKRQESSIQGDASSSTTAAVVVSRPIQHAEDWRTLSKMICYSPGIRRPGHSDTRWRQLLEKTR